MYAKKANKIYQVESIPEMQRYLRQGFDIFDDNDNIVKHNPSKTIAYTEYQRLLEENSDLQAELAELHLLLNGGSPVEEGAAAPFDVDTAKGDELKQYAKDNGIDLAGATKVEDIRKVIKAWIEAQEVVADGGDVANMLTPAGGDTAKMGGSGATVTTASGQPQA